MEAAAPSAVSLSHQPLENRVSEGWCLPLALTAGALHEVRACFASLRWSRSPEPLAGHGWSQTPPMRMRGMHPGGQAGRS